MEFTGKEAMSIRTYTRLIGLTTSAMLVLTSVVAYFLAYQTNLAGLIVGHKGVSIGLILATLFIVFPLASKAVMSRKQLAIPGLIIFSGLFGFIIAISLLYSSNKSIMYAVVFTALTTISTIGIGCTTKKDLAPLGAVLFAGLIGLIIISIFNLFFPMGTGNFWISLFGVVLFSGYIAYDTQNAKKSYYTNNGYNMTSKIVGASLNMYLDIINLFTDFLALFGGGSSSKK